MWYSGSLGETEVQNVDLVCRDVKRTVTVIDCTPIKIKLNWSQHQGHGQRRREYCGRQSPKGGKMNILDEKVRFSARNRF